MTTESSPSIWETWTENPAATAAALGLGALVGAAITFFALGGTRATGDEPPIRVRNGSIELHLLPFPSVLSFQEEQGSSDKTRWRIDTDPERGKPDYLVIVFPSDPSRCKGYWESGNKVEFVFGQNDQTIRVQATGKRTKIHAPKGLTKTADRLLQYGDNAGFITAIHIGNNTNFCTFDQKDTKLEVLILD